MTDTQSTPSATTEIPQTSPKSTTIVSLVVQVHATEDAGWRDTSRQKVVQVTYDDEHTQVESEITAQGLLTGYRSPNPLRVVRRTHVTTITDETLD